MTAIDPDRRDQVMALLERAVPATVFQTWCRNLDLQETGENAVEIPVPNPFYREWLDRELRRPLEDAFLRAFGRVPDIVFKVVPGLDLSAVAPSHGGAKVEAPQHLPVSGLPSVAPSASGAKEGLPSPVSSLPSPVSAPDGLQLNRHFTFETFVTGSSNRLAHAAAMAVAEKPGRTYNPLFLHGGVGLGKTHLLQALCQELLRRNPYARIIYVSCEQFVNDYISSIEKKRIEAFRTRYRSADLLVVDDVHFLRGKEASQEEFFHTFNTLHLSGRQIVLSSDSPPKDIRTLKEHLVSRFASGFSVSIDPPTYEMRVAIARRIADAMHKELPPDVVNYIASTLQSNVRELAGAVNRVIGIASLSHQPVDLALARGVLRNDLPARPAGIDVTRIQEVVARHYGCRPADFSAKTWRKSTSRARQICIYLCRELSTLSLADIGARFGRRDHSAAIYAIRQVEKFLDQDPALRRDIEELILLLRG